MLAANLGIEKTTNTMEQKMEANALLEETWNRKRT